MAKPVAEPLPVEMTRVEFLKPALVGVTSYEAGDVADVPEDRLKDLAESGTAKASNADATPRHPAAEKATAKKPKETR